MVLKIKAVNMHCVSYPLCSFLIKINSAHSLFKVSQMATKKWTSSVNTINTTEIVGLQHKHNTTQNSTSISKTKQGPLLNKRYFIWVVCTNY